MTIKHFVALITLGAALNPLRASANADADFAASLAAISGESRAKVVELKAAPAGEARHFRSREEVLLQVLFLLEAADEATADRIIESVGQLNVTADEYSKVLYERATKLIAARNPLVQVRVIRAVGQIASIKRVPELFISPIGATLIPALNDLDPRVRAEAAKSLGGITQYTASGDRNEAHPIISNLILVAAADPDETVRAMAAASLKSIGAMKMPSRLTP